MNKFSANVVADKMHEAVANYNDAKVCNLTTCKEVVVARVVINNDATGKKITKKGRYANPAGVPILCFMQNADRNKVVIYGIKSGKVDIVNAESVSICRKNLTTFSIKGVRYQLKDIVNGMPRFAVKHNTSRVKIKQVQEIDF